MNSENSLSEELRKLTGETKETQEIKLQITKLKLQSHDDDGNPFCIFRKIKMISKLFDKLKERGNA